MVWTIPHQKQATGVQLLGWSLIHRVRDLSLVWVEMKQIQLDNVKLDTKVYFAVTVQQGSRAPGKLAASVQMLSGI